jgi:hypothetical protein
MKLDKNRNEKIQQPIVQRESRITDEKKPIIGITYLDKNRYGLKFLLKESKGDKTIIEKLYDFLENARNYPTISALISSHASHNKFKNEDKSSLKKLAQIQNDYGVETNDMCHLHCGRGGTGEFVLHGFFLGNCFEIVWLDVKHEVHK